MYLLPYDLGFCMDNKAENLKINDDEQFIDNDLAELELEPLTNLSSEDGLSQYYSSISKYKPFSLDEEHELGKKIKQGDKEALKQLILANLRFVVSIANKYKNFGVPLLDLINQGNVGLLEAAKRYDADKGTKFITYAVWWIRQSIVHALSELGNTVKIPFRHTNNLYKINSATERLTKELGRSPNVDELSTATGINTEDINHVLMYSQANLSLDNHISNDGEKTFLDTIEDEDANVENILIAKTLKKSVDDLVLTLNPREVEIISKRFGFDGCEPQTLEEIGENLGISRERVRQIEAKALEKLKKKAIKHRLNDYLN